MAALCTPSLTWRWDAEGIGGAAVETSGFGADVTEVVSTVADTFEAGAFDLGLDCFGTVVSNFDAGGVGRAVAEAVERCPGAPSQTWCTSKMPSSRYFLKILNERGGTGTSFSISAWFRYL